MQVEEKGLTAETADRIGSFVKERGSPLGLLMKLKQEGSEFLKHEGSALALDELEVLFKALDKSKCIDKIVFDLSLARGLDYYTGVIYEAVFKGTTQVNISHTSASPPDYVSTFYMRIVVSLEIHNDLYFLLPCLSLLLFLSVPLCLIVENIYIYRITRFKIFRSGPFSYLHY